MNRKHLIYLALAAFITSIIILFNNKHEVILINNNQEIIPNHKSGFYLMPFSLVLTNKDTIRYTFDGSNPTNQSKIFNDQLLITGKESYASLSFINTTIPDSIANFGWRIPIEKQDKATVIKCAAFKNGRISTYIKTLSFFIDVHAFMPNKYKLPVISISTDKRNLYSKDKGLFIAGNNFNPNNIHSGNYHMQGKNWEREVFIQYFNKQGVLEFEQNIGMRIHGGITRRNPQKSLKFYARKDYGETEINLPFLADKGVKRFVLESMQESGGGQALIEDIVAQEIVKEIGLEQQNFQAVIVFINGEYWGLHTIRDRIDENFLAYKFDLHKDSFDIIDGNPSTDYEKIYGTNSDYIELLNFIEKNDLSLTSCFEYVSSKIDLENFIDYYSVQIFFANHDWPIHNIKIWRKKNTKWRFLLYDLDGGFTGNKRDHTLDMFSRLSNKEDCGSCGNSPDATLLFRSLMRNKEFRQKFENRYKEILQKHMHTERTLAIVDSIAKIYKPNMTSHINRWRYPWSLKNHWERDIENNIKEFLRNRPTHSLKHLNNYIKEDGYDY